MKGFIVLWYYKDKQAHYKQLGYYYDCYQFHQYERWSRQNYALH